jgi:CRP-like cAMP-binding protein
VRTDGVAVTLVMTAEELRTLLADNPDLVTGLFTTLSDFMERGATPVHRTGAGADLEQLAERGISPVEKILALQRVPLFSKVSAEEMRYLAEAAQTVPLQAGAELFPESAPPALWVVLSGELALEGAAAGPGGIATAGSGDYFGAISTMAGAAPGLKGRATRGGVALRLDRDDLIALLGERPELLRHIFSGMFRSESARLLDTRI